MKPGFTLDSTRGRPEPDAEAKANGAVVEHLRIAAGGTRGLSDCPTWLRETLEKGAWLHFADFNTNRVFDYGPNEFDKFARAPVPEGLNLGGGEEQLRQICATFLGRHPDAEIALRLIDQEVPPTVTHSEAGAMGGRGKKASRNMTGFHRDSPSGVLARLKRHRPDLAERVIAGELSANAAAIEAGFRPAMVQHPATVEGFVRAILTRLNAEQRAELRAKQW